MFLRCLSAFLLCLGSAAAGEFRVCAEPDNLPFSHVDGSGFENRIAGILAAELGMDLVYAWEPQRRAFVRKTLGAGVCDAWMGVPSDFERVLPTRPYYRSTYVFISRKGDLLSFEDRNLKSLRLGVQLPGNDLAATPPGHALALRGAVERVVGYPVYGEQPAAQRIVEAIARGELDAGVVWGPAAGFFAVRHKLSVSAAHAPPELPTLPFTYAISIGVKNGDRELRERLNGALERRRAEIDAILAEYSVPLLP